MTFLQSSYNDILLYNNVLPSSIFHSNLFSNTDYQFPTSGTAYSSPLIPLSDLIALNQYRTFNYNIFSLDTGSVVPVTHVVTYNNFLDYQLSFIGLTEEDFFNIFPSKTLSKAIDRAFEVNVTHSLSSDSLNDYTNVESLRSQYQSSVPIRKLQYPEPFIASASFIHSDIGFIHVLQYNY